jgi:hypothetical protein
VRTPTLIDTPWACTPLTAKTVKKSRPQAASAVFMLLIFTNLRAPLPAKVYPQNHKKSKKPLQFPAMALIVTLKMKLTGFSRLQT